MVVLTVTDEQMAALLANGDPFEVRDRAGRVITAARADRPTGPPPGFPPEWTKEELDRRVREGKRYTTTEVMEHLRGLTK